MGIGSNQLLTGFFKLKPEQHAALVQRSGGDVPSTYADLGVAPPDIEIPPPPLAEQAEPVAIPSPPPPAEAVTQDIIAEPWHTKAQWQLARMGRALGLDIWIPPADRNRTYQGQRLGDLSVQELPGLGIPVQVRPVIENIDVLWIDGGIVIAAFEVEHSTAVYSDILRLSDLVSVQPYTSIRLFVVAAQERRKKVAQELERPTFRLPKPPLKNICRFLSYERLGQRLGFAEEHGAYLKLDWIEGLAEP